MQTVQEMENSFCGNCGAALEAGVEFCGECGTPVNAAPYSAAAKNKPAKSKKGTAIIILIVAIAAVIAFSSA